MRYSLAKGGCMHFTCPQCGFQFCSGCQQAFHKDGVGFFLVLNRLLLRHTLGKLVLMHVR
ncbi:hypothetical protein DPMN_170674 [Dreissena polymorpha]|uniref:IBR domain-containing protein n=1 Tax=Dreissena polymorpha TaxID=45954 RepID=A0A9D4DWL0_DREPO|nr:hypothetical protein DPMN_170674 [Dreissena polymorpha]